MRCVSYIDRKSSILKTLCVEALVGSIPCLGKPKSDVAVKKSDVRQKPALASRKSARACHEKVVGHEKVLALSRKSGWSRNSARMSRKSGWSRKDDSRSHFVADGGVNLSRAPSRRKLAP